MQPIDTSDPQYQVGYSYALSIWGLAFLLAIYHQTRRLALYYHRRKWLKMVAPEILIKRGARVANDPEADGVNDHNLPRGDGDIELLTPLAPPTPAYVNQNQGIPRLS